MEPVCLLFLNREQYWEAGLFGQGAVLGGRTPTSPIQEGPFPQSSYPPRGESKAMIGLKPAILVPSGSPPLPMYWTLYKAFKKTLTNPYVVLALVGGKHLKNINLAGRTPPRSSAMACRKFLAGMRGRPTALMALSLVSGADSH